MSCVQSKNSAHQASTSGSTCHSVRRERPEFEAQMPHSPAFLLLYTDGLQVLNDEFRFPVSLYSTNSRVYSRPTASSDQPRICRKARSQATTAFKFRVITPSVIDCISSLLYYSGHSVSCPHSLFLSKSSVTWR